MRPCLARILIPLLLCACAQTQEDQGPRYRPVADTPRPVLRLAIHPLYNPHTLAAAYGPLLDLVNRGLEGDSIQLEASLDYADFERKVRAGEVELLLPNPWQTLLAIREGYSVVAMAGEPEDFRGIFITRRDSPIRTPEQLKGQVVAYPSPTALAACMMPQWFLHERGVDPVHDLDNRFVGSQESAILNAYLGLAAVGVTWPPPWRMFCREHPEKAAELKVLWETPPLPSTSIMVRNDLVLRIAAPLCSLLTGLEHSAEGRRVLDGIQTRRFLTADNKDYEPVQEFIERFERDVRPVEAP